MKEEIKCQGCKNLTKEFEKLLTMLKDKFPNAFQYYKERLKPVSKYKPESKSTQKSEYIDNTSKSMQKLKKSLRGLMSPIFMLLVVGIILILLGFENLGMIFLILCLGFLTVPLIMMFVLFRSIQKMMKMVKEA